MVTFEAHAATAGPASVLRRREIPTPTAQAGEVLIAVEAAGVAFGDVMLRLGGHPSFKPPITPGYDVVGRVIDLGAGVDSFVVGQRVAAFVSVGGYSTHVAALEKYVVAAPEKAPAESVAAAILNYITAYQMLTRSAQVEAGDSILVHGAAGGVGTALLDLARVMDLTVLGTASKAKHGLVQGLGAQAIDYAAEDFVSVAREAGGVQAVFDHIGGHHLLRSAKALRPSGTVVSYGAYDAFKGGERGEAAISELDPTRLLNMSAGLVGYRIGVWRDARNRAFREDFQAVMGLLGEGRIAPVIDTVMPLAQAAEAQMRLEQAKASGKIVLSMA